MFHYGWFGSIFKCPLFELAGQKNMAITSILYLAAKRKKLKTAVAIKAKRLKKNLQKRSRPKRNNLPSSANLNCFHPVRGLTNPARIAKNHREPDISAGI